MINFKETIVQKKAVETPILITKTVLKDKNKKYVGRYFKVIVKLS